MTITKPIRSRIIAIIVTALLLIGAGQVWTRFCGSPVVRLGMRSNVMKYLQDKYPSGQFTYLSGAYDFLNDSYGASLRSVADPDVTFTVRYSQGRPSTDDFEESRLAHEATETLTPIVRAVLPGATVLANAFLPAGQPYTDVHYAAILQADVSVAIGWERPDITKEDFVRTSLTVLNALREQGYNLSSCQFWCELGEREYSLQLDSAQMQLGEAELLKLVTQPGKW